MEIISQEITLLFIFLLNIIYEFSQKLIIEINGHYEFHS